MLSLFHFVPSASLLFKPTKLGFCLQLWNQFSKYARNTRQVFLRAFLMRPPLPFWKQTPKQAPFLTSRIGNMQRDRLIEKIRTKWWSYDGLVCPSSDVSTQGDFFIDSFVWQSGSIFSKIYQSQMHKFIFYFHFRQKSKWKIPLLFQHP